LLNIRTYNSDGVGDRSNRPAPGARGKNELIS
jgi:hypothetical protein